MATRPAPRMTAEEFIAWSMDQPQDHRYELADGDIVAMAPERVRHARVKGRVFRRLDVAIENSGLRCTVFPDGMAVRVDEHTVYEPDAAVRCGEALPDDAMVYDDPLIVVEVLSPSTISLDTGDKLSDYFRLASLRHYLIVRTHRQAVIHHERMEGGTIQTRIIAAGFLHLEPPGITLDVVALFP